MGTRFVIQALQSTGENTEQEMGLGSTVSAASVYVCLSYDALLKEQWLFSLGPQFRFPGPSCL